MTVDNMLEEYAFLKTISEFVKKDKDNMHKVIAAAVKGANEQDEYLAKKAAIMMSGFDAADAVVAGECELNDQMKERMRKAREFK